MVSCLCRLFFLMTWLIHAFVFRFVWCFLCTLRVALKVYFVLIVPEKLHLLLYLRVSQPFLLSLYSRERKAEVRERVANVRHQRVSPGMYYFTVTIYVRQYISFWRPLSFFAAPETLIVAALCGSFSYIFILYIFFLF